MFESIFDKKETLNFAFPDIFTLQRTYNKPSPLLLELSISFNLADMFNVFCLWRNYLHLNYCLVLTGIRIRELHLSQTFVVSNYYSQSIGGLRYQEFTAAYGFDYHTILLAAITKPVFTKDYFWIPFVILILQ